MAFCVLAVGACGTPDEEAKPRPLPEERRELRLGEYRTDGFEPPYSFRVGGAYPVYLWEKDRASFVVLEDVEGETVTVGFISLAAEFDEHVPEAQKVLDTVEWRGG